MNGGELELLETVEDPPVRRVWVLRGEFERVGDELDESRLERVRRAVWPEWFHTA